MNTHLPKGLNIHHVGLVLLVIALFTGGLIVSSLPPKVTLAANNDTLYVSPASGSHTVGSSFTVTIYENSYTDSVNTVEADLTYSTSKLQYVSSAYGSAWGVQASKSGGSGSAKIAEGTISPHTGLQTVGSVTFKALAAGSASLTFANTSAVDSSTTNTNVVSTMTGGTYTLASATTSPSPTPSTSPKPTTKPKPGPVTTPKPSSSTTTTITPTNNPKGVTVPNNSQVEMNQPGTVSTTAGGSNMSITKVEYYLNGKLVATVSQSPFDYSVNTKDLRNGTYKLTTKTTYTDGTTDSKDTSLIVKNPFGATQVKLQAQHYAAYIVLLLVALCAGVWFLVRRKSNSFMGSMAQQPSVNPQQPGGFNQNNNNQNNNNNKPPEAHIGTM